jgi:hypothetical protein
MTHDDCRAPPFSGHLAIRLETLLRITPNLFDWKKVRALRPLMLHVIFPIRRCRTSNQWSKGFDRADSTENHHLNAMRLAFDELFGEIATAPSPDPSVGQLMCTGGSSVNTTGKYGQGVLVLRPSDGGQPFWRIRKSAILSAARTLQNISINEKRVVCTKYRYPVRYTGISLRNRVFLNEILVCRPRTGYI